MKSDEKEKLLLKVEILESIKVTLIEYKDELRKDYWERIKLVDEKMQYYDKLINKEYKTKLKEHKKEILSTINKWIILTFSVLSFMGFFSFYNAYQWGIRKVGNNISKKIDKEFEKDNIQKIIKTEADELTKKHIDKNVNPFLEKMENIIDESSKVVEMNRLIIYAEAGDRNAYTKLKEIESKDKEEYKLAKMILLKLYNKYNSGMYSRRTFEKIHVSNSELKNLIKDSNVYIRETVIYTIERRKLYEYIPILIEFIDTEENLDVYAAVIRVLNSMFKLKRGKEVKVFQEDAKAVFSKLWAKQKSSLMNKK